MIFEINSSRGGGGVCIRRELAGASPMTSKAMTAPISDQDKRIKTERRFRDSLHRHAAGIPRPRIVIIRAVGGSESPPIPNGIRKHAACAQSEGRLPVAFLICRSKNAPQKGMKTTGAK